MKPDNKCANSSNPESEGNYFNLFVKKTVDYLIIFYVKHTKSIC